MSSIIQEPHNKYLPESIDNCALLLSDVLVIPVPRFRVDRLADTSQDTQGAEIMALNVVRPKTTKESDSGGGRVKLGELVFRNGLPVTRGRGIDRSGLKHGGGDPVCERAVNNVAEWVRELWSCIVWFGSTHV
jgi:hypothetical protein